MHMAISKSADPTQLAEVSGTYLRRTLALSSSFSVFVAPSSAAAYVIALAACMVRVDPLSVNPSIHQPSSLAVIHDTLCQGSPLAPCSFLLGAINWYLGSSSTPMDTLSLSTVVANNRVAAVLHQPYHYPQGSQHTPLSVISSICHSQEKVSLIQDMDGLPVEFLSLSGIGAAVKESFVNGVDIILLPDTGKARGPPQTCVFVGRAALLKEVDLTLLQPQICLPLSCTTYDLIGTVVAYKTLPVN